MPEDVGVDENQNVFFCGTYVDNPPDWDPGPGIVDLGVTSGSFFLKLNPAGNLQWVKVIESADITASEIVSDPDGNAIIAGHFMGTHDFDPDATGTHLMSSMGSARDGFILKLDPAGNFTWAQAISSMGSESTGEIRTDAAGNIYWSGAHDIGNKLGVAKLDASGSFQWIKSMTSTGSSTFSDGKTLDIDAAGNVYVGGYADAPTTDLDPGPGVLNHTGTGSQDIVMLKLDNDGEMIWAKAIGGTHYQRLVSLAIDTSRGDILFTGRYQADTLDLDPGAGFAPAEPYHESGVSTVFICKWSQCELARVDQNVTVCNSYTSPYTGEVWYDDGTYTDFLLVDGGCDSVFNLNLTVLATNDTITISGCNTGVISPSGNYTWTTPGPHPDTLTNSLGCDSILTVYVSFLPVEVGVINTPTTLTSVAVGATWQWISCDGIPAIIPGETGSSFTPTACGYYAVVVTQGPCSDTSICYPIGATHDTITMSGCNTGVVSPSGNYVWTTPGPHADTLTSSLGCDSILTVYVSFLPVEVGVINTPTTLTSVAVSATWQWISCDGVPAIIPGETGSSFTPTVSGSYAVVVTQGPCSDTSACYPMAGPTGRAEPSAATLRVWPNPATDVIHVESSVPVTGLELINPLGQILRAESCNHSYSHLLDVSNLPSGIYWIRVVDEGNTSQYLRVLVE